MLTFSELEFKVNNRSLYFRSLVGQVMSALCTTQPFPWFLVLHDIRGINDLVLWQCVFYRFAIGIVLLSVKIKYTYLISTHYFLLHTNKVWLAHCVLLQPGRLGWPVPGPKRPGSQSEASFPQHFPPTSTREISLNQVITITHATFSF